METGNVKYLMLYTELRDEIIRGVCMPITLHTAAARLPRREGFAFGLTTLALLVGFLLSGIRLPRLTADIVVAATGLLAAMAVGLSSPGRRADK